MLVRDVMARDVATIGREAPLAEAVRLMLERKVSGLAVVSAGRRLVGMLTESDLLCRAETGTGARRRPWWIDRLVCPGRSAAEYVRTHSRHVGDLMTREVATLGEDAPLTDVVTIMERRRIKHVPVVWREELVGMITRVELLALLGEELRAEAEREEPGDAAILDHLRAELRAEPWCPAANLGISVRDGVVTLDGVVTHERARNAILVAARNTCGVKRVENNLVWVEPATGRVMPPT